MTKSGSVEVLLSSKNSPASFTWRGRTYRVKQTQECWRQVGAWWDGEGERTFFRVLTSRGGIYELCFDHIKSAWSITAVCD